MKKIERQINKILKLLKIEKELTYVEIATILEMNDYQVLARLEDLYKLKMVTKRKVNDSIKWRLP